MILRPTTPSDIPLLASTLRECDRQEIALGSGRSGQQAVSYAVDSSMFTETIETPSGSVAGIWGVTPTPIPGLGSIWMLGSQEIETVSLRFLRACRPSIDKAHGRYPTLLCAPWRENALHLRWLTWLGFTLEEVGHPHFLRATRHV